MNGFVIISAYSVLLSTACAYQSEINLSDEFLNSYQLIQKYGYEHEKISLVTEDDYVVNLFRIPKKGPPVLLVHGIADSSDSWLVLGPQESLAFMLADQNFDIWIFNARGNKYSKGHVQDLNQKQYWDFSFEEMGTKDLAATIDHILDTTGYSKLTYIGFSQGTTIFLVLCSQRVDYNEKIEQAILLAPVAKIDNTKYPFIEIYTSHLDSLVSLADIVGLYELFSENYLNNVFHAWACRQGRPAKLLCELEYLLSYGIRNASANVSPEKFPVIGSHIPAGTSSKTFVHFLQLYRSKRFQRFDYGSKRNKVVYKSREPPEYDVSLVSVPITIFASEDDWFSDIEDVQFLKNRLPNIVRYVLFNKTLQFSHIEYVYGSRAKALINDELVNILVNEIM